MASTRSPSAEDEACRLIPNVAGRSFPDLVDALALDSTCDHERMIWTEQGLRDAGFSGFVPLVEVKPELIPSSPGVYVVLRLSETPPIFLAKNKAWPFRGDPTVDQTVLADCWVTGSPAVYIGKAATLRSRIGAYRRHGTGGHSKHWAGRYVWQLADHRQLLVCWRACAEGEEPEAVETDLISDFRAQYGSRPFANLTK